MPTCIDLKDYELSVIQSLPVFITFAIIGILFLIATIVFFIYKIFKPSTGRQNTEKSSEEDVVPWLAISSPQQARFVPINPSLNLVPRNVILNDPERRHGVDELDLWERKQSECTNRPYWKFTSADYPASPQSVKNPIQAARSVSEIVHGSNSIFIPHTPHESIHSGDIHLVRKALQDSKIKNSSSAWLHFAGSKSF